MSFLSTSLGQYVPSSRKLAPLLVVVLGTATAIGVAAARQPLLAIGVVLAVSLIGILTRWTDAATLIVVFLLYTNAPVVAAQFHGVPYMVSAAVPALLVIPLTAYLILHRQRLVFPPVLMLLVIYFMVQSVGALFAVDFDTAVAQLTVFLTEGLGLYFLIINAVRTSDTLRRVIWALLLAGALLGGLSLYQQITGTFSNNYGGFAQIRSAGFKTGEIQLEGDVEQPRMAGSIGEQNRYAQTLLMLVPLGLFQFWREQSRRLRIIALMATGLIALGVALTFSRGAAVGFILMIVLTFLLGYIKPRQMAIISVGLVLLMQAMPQYGLRLASLEAPLRMITEGDETDLSSADNSTRSRLTEMAGAAFMALDHPLIGVGPGMSRYYYQAYADRVGLRVLNADRQTHNLYLGVAAETGLLGLFCFLAILFVTLRDLVRARQYWLKSRPELADMATGFMLAIISYLTTGLFLHFAYIRFFWAIMALACATSCIARTEAPVESTR